MLVFTRLPRPDAAEAERERQRREALDRLKRTREAEEAEAEAERERERQAMDERPMWLRLQQRQEEVRTEHRVRVTREWRGARRGPPQRYAYHTPMTPTMQQHRPHWTDGGGRHAERERNAAMQFRNFQYANGGGGGGGGGGAQQRANGVRDGGDRRDEDRNRPHTYYPTAYALPV